MSTIQPKLPAVSSATLKRPEMNKDTKCPTPKDIAAELRTQADADLQRAQQLKAEAERLKSEGMDTAGKGAAQVAEGVANVAGGHGKIHDGRKQQADGQDQVTAGIEQEKQGLAKEQDGIDSFSNGLTAAQDLNKQSKVVTGMAALGVITEGVYTAEVNQHNQTFAEQLKDAVAINAELGVQLGDLQTQSAAEADANNQVIAGNAQFDAGLAQNREGTATLLAGVAHQTAAAGKGEKAAQAENHANVFQIHGETHAAMSDAAKEQSIDSSILAGQEFAQATKLENKAAKQEQEGKNALSVADLLARAAAIDTEAGGALQEIPGFLAEGSKTKIEGGNKASSAETRRQDGLTHLANSDHFSSEAEVSFSHGVEYAKEAADLAQQSRDLSNQSEQEISNANAKREEAAKLQAQADELQATGDEQVAQGKKDRIEGSMAAAGGLASMSGGLVAEQDAHNQMNATSANIPGITDRQTASQAERSETLDKANAAYDKITEVQDFLTQTTEVQADLAAQKQANLEGRADALSNIIEGERLQTGAYKQQHEGLESVQSGTDEEREGHEQVTTGQNQIAQGKTKVHEGTQEIKKGDQTGQAGAVLENKGNQYNQLADEAEGSKK